MSARRITSYAILIVAGLGCSHADRRPADHSVKMVADTRPEAAASSPAWYAGVPAMTKQEWEAAHDPESGGARDAIKEPITREQALAFLMNAGMFGTPDGGLGGTAAAVPALKVVLAQPDAAAAVRELVRRGHAPGQLYGLVGLYILDRRAFDAAAQPFFARTDATRYRVGCIGETKSVGQIARELSNGTLPNAYWSAMQSGRD